jgi:septum formation protein
MNKHTLRYPSLQQFASNVHLILGSGSSTRKLILDSNSFKFEVVKADINEKEFGDRSSGAPTELVQMLSNAKADAIMRQHFPAGLITPSENIFLLTADQVVVHNGKILEKPCDEAEAVRFMNSYSGHHCTTVGSLALTHLLTQTRVSDFSTATIHFNSIPQLVIDSIVSEGTCLHCAGGLMAEHELLQPYISHIDGTVDSIMGLSCELLERLFVNIYSQLGIKTSLE